MVASISLVMVGSDNRRGISSSAPERLLGVPDCSDDSWEPPNIVDGDGVDAVAVDPERDMKVEPPCWMFRSRLLIEVAVALGA